MAIQLPDNPWGMRSLTRTGIRPLHTAPKKSGYNNTEVAKMIREFEKRMKSLLNEIPAERKRFTKWLKETGFVDKHGKRVFDYNKLDKYDRKKAVVQQGFSQISQGVESSISRVFASIAKTHPDFTREGLSSFGDVLAEALAEGTNEGARIVYDKWQRNLIGKAGFLKTGHHVEPLMALWPALMHLPPKLRQQTLQKLSNEGFTFGESSLDAIFQIIHREGDLTKLSKDWRKVLGGVDETWLDLNNPRIKAKAANKLAHASRIGGTSGGELLKPKPDLLRGVTNSDEAASLLRPYVRVAKNAGDVSHATSEALEKIIRNDNGTLKTAEQIQTLIKDGSFERAIDSVPEIGIIDKQDLTKFRPRGQVITGEDLGWRGQAPGAMMMQADGTAALDPVTDWKKTLMNIDAPQAVKNQLAAFTEANDMKGALQFARTSRGMPWMAGLSIPLGEWANAERRREIEANPDDNWLKLQYVLDDWSLKADYASVGTYALAATGKGVAVPGGLELSSNLAALGSLGMDLKRWGSNPEAVKETMDSWKSIWSRGTRGLLKGAQQLF